MLKGALTNIQKMKIEEQKKAVRSGYDMDILPTDIITYEKDTLDLLDDLNSSNQKMVKMTFLLTCYGRNKRELENITQRNRLSPGEMQPRGYAVFKEQGRDDGHLGTMGER